MPPDAVVLAATAVGFAIISGANDGAALVALPLKLSALRPILAALLLALALLAGALLLGTDVATTLATRLVPFGGSGSLYPLAVAVGSAAAVVGILSRFGLPTSLTLALIGGITGAGVGFALPVAWEVVAFVLVIGALAPAVGLVLGFGLVHLARALPPSGSAAERIARAHQGAFGLLCLAYAVNDGQKMLAIFAIAFGTARPVVEPHVGQLITISVLFFCGTLVGVRRLAGTLGVGVLLSRPLNIVSAEFAAASAVLGSAALGAPVSITQSVTGGLVGSGVTQGYGKVRWRTASQIALAWVVTLPAALACASGIGFVTRAVNP